MPNGDNNSKLVINEVLYMQIDTLSLENDEQKRFIIEGGDKHTDSSVNNPSLFCFRNYVWIF